MTTRIPSLIAMLGSSNDNEVLSAARALVRELANNNQHLTDLAQAWEKTQAQRPVQPKAKPFDYTQIETAVTLYTQGKVKVTTNKVIQATKEMLKEEPPDVTMAYRYIAARLRSLGFQPSQSLNTWTREAECEPSVPEGWPR